MIIIALPLLLLGECELTLTVNREMILERDHLVVRAVIENHGEEAVRLDPRSVTGGGVIRRGGHILYERNTPTGWVPLWDMDARSNADFVRTTTPTLAPGGAYAEYARFWLSGEHDFVFEKAGTYEIRAVVETSVGDVRSKPVRFRVKPRHEADRERIEALSRKLYFIGRPLFPNEIPDEVWVLKDLGGNLGQGVRNLEFLDRLRKGDKMEDDNVAKCVHRQMKGIDAEIGLITLGYHFARWERWEYLRQIVDALPYETISSHGWSKKLDLLTPPQFIPTSPSATRE
jgi:hypothetical protein